MDHKDYNEYTPYCTILNQRSSRPQLTTLTSEPLLLPSVRRPRRMPKASDVLADQIRVWILSDGLEEGDELPSESDLMQQTGFSRGTVREAIRLLEADGLVTTKRGPGGGLRVRRPGLDQISRALSMLLSLDRGTLREFFIFRKAIEPTGAALAATSSTREQREWIIELAHEEAAADRGSEDAVGFHEAVWLITNNHVFKTVLTALHQVMEWHAPNQHLSPEDRTQQHRAHKRIARAIADADADAAHRSMLRHITAFEQLTEQQGRLDDPVVPPQSWRWNTD